MSVFDTINHTHCYLYTSYVSGTKMARYSGTSKNNGTDYIRYGHKNGSDYRWSNAIYCAFPTNFYNAMTNAIIDCVKIEFITEGTFHSGPVYLYSCNDDNYDIEQWKPSYFSSDKLDGDPLGDNTVGESEGSIGRIYILTQDNCERFRQKILKKNYIFMLYDDADETKYTSDSVTKCSAFLMYIIWHYKTGTLSIDSQYTSGTNEYNPNISFYFNNNYFRQNSVYSSNTYSQEYHYCDNISPNIQTGYPNHSIKYRYCKDTANSIDGWQKCIYNSVSEEYDPWINIAVNNSQAANNLYTYQETYFNSIFTNSLFDNDYCNVSLIGYTTQFSTSYYTKSSSEITTLGTYYKSVNAYLNDSIAPTLTITSRNVYNGGYSNAPLNAIAGWTGDIFTYNASTSSYGTSLVSISLNYKYDSIASSKQSLSSTTVYGGTINSNGAYNKIGAADATLTVTDSRGRSTSVTSVREANDYFVEYSTPKYNEIPTVKRTDNLGVEDDNGSYITVSYDISAMKDIAFDISGTTTDNYIMLRFKITQGYTDITNYITKTIAISSASSITGTEIIGRSIFTGISEYDDTKTDYKVNDVCTYTSGGITHRYVCNKNLYEALPFSTNNWDMEDFQKDKTYTVSCEIKDLAWERKGEVGYAEEHNVAVASAQYVLHVKSNGKAIGIGTTASETNNTISTTWDINTVTSNGTIKTTLSDGAFETGNGVPAGKRKIVSLLGGSSNWPNKTQTVTISGLSANADLFISPSPSNYFKYAENKIYCSSQAVNSITFTCSDIPDDTISVNLIAFGGIPTAN